MTKDERVWAYLLKNRKTATATSVALNCDVSVDEAQTYMDKIASTNWREEVREPLTEGVKFDTDKPRMDLVPPEAVEALAHVLTYGAAKYSERNWELGMKWGRPYAALFRHMLAWWGGENKDPETGMSHLWHAMCCVAFLIAFEERGAGTDDRPNTKTSSPGTQGGDPRASRQLGDCEET